MSLKKQFLKNKPVCKVKFTLQPEEAGGAKEAFLVGDFNSWNKGSTPMGKLRDGSFTVTMDLEKGKEYQFRYHLDGVRWENDWDADRYVHSPYGDCDNSVVIT